MNWLQKTVLPKIKALVTPETSKENLWVKCASCSQMIFHREFETHFNVCPACGHHMPIEPAMRMRILFDNGEAEIIPLDGGGDSNSGSAGRKDDPLGFRDRKRYGDRLKEARAKTGMQDAILVARGRIGGNDAVVAAFDFRFMGGSMGRAVGTGIIKAAETAIGARAALIIVTGTGGARMQEGVFSLMQLPRTITYIRRVREAGLPYIALLAHPTTGGVTASFGMLGDLHIAEPGAIIGFAGRRVIEETVNEKLPEGFQTAEYLKEHGMVDMVVLRSEQNKVIGRILSMLMGRTARDAAE